MRKWKCKIQDPARSRILDPGDPVSEIFLGSWHMSAVWILLWYSGRTYWVAKVIYSASDFPNARKTAALASLSSLPEGGAASGAAAEAMNGTWRQSHSWWDTTTKLAVQIKWHIKIPKMLFSTNNKICTTFKILIFLEKCKNSLYKTMPCHLQASI